ADQVALVEGELRTRRGEAGGDHRAAIADHLIGRLHRGDGAGQLHGIIDAALGDVAQLLQRLRVLRVDGVRGAELAGEAELRVVDVDGDDLLRPGQPRTEQPVQPDA